MSVSHWRSQVHAVLSEMRAAAARDREVMASPRPSSLATALAIRLASAARRASASGSRAARQLRQTRDFRRCRQVQHIVRAQRHDHPPVVAQGSVAMRRLA